MAKTEQTGLYNATNEHDACGVGMVVNIHGNAASVMFVGCGVGMVVNIHGNKSHELVDSALKVLENMRHPLL